MKGCEKGEDIWEETEQRRQYVGATERKKEKTERDRNEQMDTEWKGSREEKKKVLLTERESQI